MKKIALIAFLLIVCVAAGRAQESRQDISLSGTGLVEPFIASSTDVQVSANRAFGAMVSYRFMLTPSSAIEANYGITYQNKIHYVISNTNHYVVLTRTQEMSAAYVRSFNFRKYNPFVEAGPAAFIFLPCLLYTSCGRAAAQDSAGREPGHSQAGSLGGRDAFRPVGAGRVADRGRGAVARLRAAIAGVAARGFERAR